MMIPFGTNHATAIHPKFPCEVILMSSGARFGGGGCCGIHATIWWMRLRFGEFHSVEVIGGKQILYFDRLSSAGNMDFIIHNIIIIIICIQ